MSAVDTLEMQLAPKKQIELIEIAPREIKRAIVVLKDLLDSSMQFVNFENVDMQSRLREMQNAELTLSTASFWPIWKFFTKAEIIYTMTRTDAMRLLCELEYRVGKGLWDPVSISVKQLRYLPLFRTTK